jgi:hypothetical protein
VTGIYASTELTESSVTVEPVTGIYASTELTESSVTVEPVTSIYASTELTESSVTVEPVTKNVTPATTGLGGSQDQDASNTKSI